MATVPRRSSRSERNVHRDTGYDSDNIDHLTAVELDEEIAKTERRIAALSESCRRETVDSSRDLDDHVTIRRRTAAGGTRLLATSASDGTGGGTSFDRDSVDLKVGADYPCSRPVLTGRIDGPSRRVQFSTPVLTAVNSAREDGRPKFTRRLGRVDGPCRSPVISQKSLKR